MNTSFYHPDTILVYEGDTLKGFMTVQAYASIHKLVASDIRTKLHKHNQMVHGDNTLRPGISFQ